MSPRMPPHALLQLCKLSLTGWEAAGVGNTVGVGARMCRVELENLPACETGEEGLGERKRKTK